MASLRDLVTKQVANAFTQLGDLKQQIVFSLASSRNYDFTTGEVLESNTSVTLDGVIEFVTVNEDNGVNSILDGLQVKFIVNRVDLPANYAQYDSFTTNGKTYKIVNFNDNGYSVEGTGVGG